MDEQGKRHIIYIEDDVEMIGLVKLILERKGYRVTGAEGGREGLELIQKELPDLVLLDLMMPDIDGWDIFQNMRGIEVTQNIPVIVVTAKAQNIDRVLGLHIAKVDDYISKPFKPQDLISSVSKVLSKSTA